MGTLKIKYPYVKVKQRMSQQLLITCGNHYMNKIN